MQGWSWMICTGKEGWRLLLEGWSGCSVIHIPPCLLTCSVGWEGIRDEARCADPKLLPDLRNYCPPSALPRTCKRKYVVQGDRHKNRREISELIASCSRFVSELFLICSSSVRSKFGPKGALCRLTACSEYTWELVSVLPGVQSRSGI